MEGMRNFTLLETVQAANGMIRDSCIWEIYRREQEEQSQPAKLSRQEQDDLLTADLIRRGAPRGDRGEPASHTTLKHHLMVRAIT